MVHIICYKCNTLFFLEAIDIDTKERRKLKVHEDSYALGHNEIYINDIPLKCLICHIPYTMRIIYEKEMIDKNITIFVI